ncbi:MAG: thioredoxin family protein [Terriglobales bacterium]
MIGLLIFRADWCPHCRLMERAGVVAKLKAERPDLPVTVEDLTKGETELSRSLNVRTIPAFILIDDDGEVVKRTSGSKTADQLVRFTK